MYKRRMILGVLIALAILLAAGWLAFAGSKTGGASSQIRKPRNDFADWREQLVRKGSKELRRDEPEQADRFAFMQGEVEAMPEKMRRAIAVAVGGVAPLGLRFDRSQLVPAGIGVGVWITEGDGVTCISLAADGSTSCDTSVHAWRQGLPLEVFKPGTSPRDQPTHFLALGLVPNWASAVRMRIGGQFRLVKASQGVYAFRAGRPIRVVSIVR